MSSHICDRTLDEKIQSTLDQISIQVVSLKKFRNTLTAQAVTGRVKV